MYYFLIGFFCVIKKNTNCSTFSFPGDYSLIRWDFFNSAVLVIRGGVRVIKTQQCISVFSFNFLYYCYCTPQYTYATLSIPADYFVSLHWTHAMSWLDWMHWNSSSSVWYVQSTKCNRKRDTPQFRICRLLLPLKSSTFPRLPIQYIQSATFPWLHKKVSGSPRSFFSSQRVIRFHSNNDALE